MSAQPITYVVILYDSGDPDAGLMKPQRVHIERPSAHPQTDIAAKLGVTRGRVADYRVDLSDYRR